MGGNSSKSKTKPEKDKMVEYRISVKTGDKKGPGSDANVWCKLYQDKHVSTESIKLQNALGTDNEKVFSLSAKYLSSVDTLEICRCDRQLCDEWFVDTVHVSCVKYNEPYVFPFLRWVKDGRTYKVQCNDTSLARNDPHQAERLKDIREKRVAYQMEVKITGLPTEVKSLPSEEWFSFSYSMDIAELKEQMVKKSKIALKDTGTWTNLDDLGNIYTDTVFTKPLCLANDTWQRDDHFGYQRLCGVNHSVINLCTEIPEKLAVTPEMLEPFLEGDTLHGVISRKKLFYVDLEITDGISTKEGLTVCSPVALFYQNQKSVLVPIAIQLKQKPADDNPVFLPSDPQYTWLAAKMWFNNADASYHESIAHLGFTHMIMEGCVCATYRNLAYAHPIFKLLGPHFLNLLSINWVGQQVLFSKTGFVQHLMSIGRDGMLELIRRKLGKWRMDEDGTLPVELEKRGVLDPTVLQGYHYRDDALALYYAIKTYITNYVHLYYDSPSAYIEDHELQNWGQALVTLRSQGGCGLLGVPGDGIITNEGDLIIILTSMIFTLSVTHASVNFPQYEQYGFPPNYPMTIKGTPPTDKSPLTEECIFHAVPDKKTTIHVMSLAKTLSMFGTDKLGDFPKQYIYDPKAQPVVAQFRKELLVLSKRVEDLNKTRVFPYKWLDPTIVPNSISI